MTKEDRDMIEKYVNKTSLTSGETAKLQMLIKKYIDPSCWICTTCPTQIRFAWIRLRDWWSLQNKNNYTFIKKLN